MFDIPRTARHLFLNLHPDQPLFPETLRKWELIVRCSNEMSKLCGQTCDIVYCVDEPRGPGEAWRNDPSNLELCKEYAECILTEMFNIGVTMDVGVDSRMIIREEMQPTYSTTCEVFAIRFYIASCGREIDQGSEQCFDKWTTLDLLQALRERVLSDSPGNPTKAGLDIPAEPLHYPRPHYHRTRNLI